MKMEDRTVSLNAVIESIKNQYNKHNELIPKWLSIGDLPSVTPQRPTGHWIDYSDEGYVECPFCGHATNCEDNIDELHYCFYCGAQLVEPQESEVNE